MRKSRGARIKIQQKAPLTYSLTHANQRFFLDVNIPEGTQNVVLTGNRFVDFVGFKPVDSIETLNLDNNPILSFRGFPLMPNLRSLSMIGTPIAGLQNFRVQALACCGPKLRYINGSDVTSNEKSAAAAFGDQKLSHDFLIRGWIPKKPIAIQPDRGIDYSKSTGKKGAPQALPAKKRIEKIVESQDADPVSVRAVRVLRAQGNDTAQIRAFLRKHFAPTKEKEYTGKAPTYKKKQETAVEVQIQHQQELINVMAAQLQALRTGNRTFNEYNEMVETAGRLLIENAEFLARLESGEPLEKTETVKVVRRDYELLRAAIVEFLDVDASTPDCELISALNEIPISDSVPEKRSSSSSSSDSSFELTSQHTETSHAASSISSGKDRGVELEAAAPEPDNEAKSSSSHKSHSSKHEDEKTESDKNDSDDKKSSDSSDSSDKEELSEGSSSDHEEKEQKQAEILSEDPTPMDAQAEEEAQEEPSVEEVFVEKADDVQARETPADDQRSSSRSSKRKQSSESAASESSSKKRKNSTKSAASASSSKNKKQSNESAASENSSKRRKDSTESAASASSSKKRKQSNESAASASSSKKRKQNSDKASRESSASEASEKSDDEVPDTKDASDEHSRSSRSSRSSRKHSRESSASERSSRSKKHSDDKHSHSSRSKSRQASDEPAPQPEEPPKPEPVKEEQAKASTDTDNHSKASSKRKSSDDSDNFSPFKSETSSYFKSPKDKQPSDSPKEEQPQEEKKVTIYPDNIPRSQRLPPPTSPMGRRGSPGRRRPTILHNLK